MISGDVSQERENVKSVVKAVLTSGGDKTKVAGEIEKPGESHTENA